VLLLLVVAWAPIPATRMVIPVVLMCVLAVSGLAVLRRQVAEEFPDVTSDTVRASWRGGVTRAAAAVVPARHGNGKPHREAETVVVPAAPPSRVDELERLAALHDRGLLSDDELAAEKTRVIGAPAVR
jgi:hypothetical protein